MAPQQVDLDGPSALSDGERAGVTGANDSVGALLRLFGGEAAVPLWYDACGMSRLFSTMHD